MRQYWETLLISFGLVSCAPEPSNIENKSADPALSSVNSSGQQTKVDAATTQKENVQVQLTAPSSASSEQGLARLVKQRCICMLLGPINLCFLI